MSILHDVIKCQQKRATAEAAKAAGNVGAEAETHHIGEASALNADREPPVQEAGEEPPLEGRVEVELSSDEVEDTELEQRASRKRTRRETPLTERYAPDWVIYPHDSVVSKAPESARQLGGHICRGMLLPKDQRAMSQVDPISACEELMDALSLVCYLYIFLTVSCVRFLILHRLLLVLFQAAP